MKIREIRLGADAVIDQYEAKNGSVWRIATNNSPSTDFPEVVMLNKDGSPKYPLGNGIWRIVRFGHTATGHTNATAGGGKGLECDKFTQKTVEKQIDSWFGQFMKRPHSNVVRYMHIDSWECGSQNWSASFADEFQRRCGYDLSFPFMQAFRCQEMIACCVTSVPPLTISSTMCSLPRQPARPVNMEYVSPQRV